MSIIRKIFGLTPELVEKLKELQREKSFTTQTSTLQYCIIEAYERMLRNEKRVKKTSFEDEKVGIDERRKDREENKCREIAERLDGKIERSSGGFKVSYVKYSKQGNFPQAVPLLTLTEQHVKDQYFPSREVVEAFNKKKSKKLKNENIQNK